MSDRGASDIKRAAIVVAGGTGERFGGSGGKQLVEIAGRPALAWSIQALIDAEIFGLIVVVCHPERIDEYRAAAIDPIAPDIPVVLVAGGHTRQQSVANGLGAIPAGVEIVAVHDGARPLVTPTLVRAVVAAAEAPDVAGAIAGHPSVDTVKIVSEGSVTETPDRARLWAVQTPQAFKRDPLFAAYASAKADGFLGTDDASLVERCGGKVVIVEGGRDNIKITLPEDVVFAEAVLRARGMR